MASVSTPHLAFPPRLDGTRFAVVEQDTVDDVAGCVGVAALTPLGERTMRPGFGAAELEFSLPSAFDAFLDGVAASEPRARIVGRAERPVTDVLELVATLSVQRTVAA